MTNLPGFVIIGAMKAGTTSLFRWLGEHPETLLPRTKEPDFFGDDQNWMRGLSWYADLFEDAPSPRLGGEASVSYSDPTRSLIAASRMASVLPDARLIFVARDPVARLRSHYQHEVLRGRERRAFTIALGDPGSIYVTRSLYFSCLEPYILRFPRSQIHIVRFEDLFGPTDDAWSRLLTYLDLTPWPRPSSHVNRSAQRMQFSRPMKFLWSANLQRPPRVVPRIVRRAVKPLFLRRRQSPLFITADDPVPRHVLKAISDDAQRLLGWLGSNTPLWPLQTVAVQK